MYAIEFFSLSLILGCLVVIKLYKYLTSENRLSYDLEAPAKSAEQLLDIYESIYNAKNDDQMHRLAEWRKMALQNCEARKAVRLKMSKDSGVSFLDDYRSSLHEEGRTR